jgi:nanoRNase/pAp phosphatase (c-di-AMP/oligoRNAs hydrolase)
MSLSFPDQILHALKRAERPVIVLKELSHVDDFASAFGLAAVMKKLGKDTEIICASGRSPESLAFLKTAKPVKGDVPNLRSLTIHLNVSKANVDELSYSVIGDELRVHITPKNGFWNRDDVKVATTAFRYDLVITIGCQDLKSLGALQERYADFFYETPIMNIDHSASNEHFGQYNVVDVGATSVGEVLFEVAEKIDPKLVDEDIATSFLTGMIAKTKSFRTANVTPKTLATASALIAKGAKREEIVEHLYRTRSVETLRLWGRALARLKSDHEKGLVWTTLTRQDFATTSAKEESLQDIVSELLSTAPDAKLVAIFYEHTDGYVAAKLFAERPLDALALGAPFKASGTREQVRLVLPEKDIVDAEQTVIAHLKKAL